MTRRSVTDEHYTALSRRLDEIKRRVDEGTLEFEPTMDSLQAVIEGKFGVALAGFRIWKTLKRPAHASAAHYRESFKKKGISIGTYADQILDKVDFAEGLGEVDIARVYVRELGFKTNTRRDAIYKKALTSGLAKLPAWAALELRGIYDGQPNGEWLIAGMEPIADRDDDPGLFEVGRRDDGERWLYGAWGSAGREWDPGHGFLFAVPRK
jgi:hypothetical protein